MVGVPRYILFCPENEDPSRLTVCKTSGICLSLDYIWMPIWLYMNANLIIYECHLIIYECQFDYMWMPIWLYMNANVVIPLLYLFALAPLENVKCCLLGMAPFAFGIGILAEHYWCFLAFYMTKVILFWTSVFVGGWGWISDCTSCVLNNRINKQWRLNNAWSVDITRQWYIIE